MPWRWKPVSWRKKINQSSTISRTGGRNSRSTDLNGSRRQTGKRALTNHPAARDKSSCNAQDYHTGFYRMYTLSISGHQRDATASLLKEGRVVAAIEEEKLSRVKHV